MMGAVAYRLRSSLLTFAVLLPACFAVGQAAKPATTTKPATPQPAPSAASVRGKALFARDCSFCHGRDAMGGESGPDLTRSRLVARDVSGDRIREVVQGGRPDKGMPAFPKLQPAQLADLIAFLRDQTKKAVSSPEHVAAWMSPTCKRAMLMQARRISMGREDVHPAILRPAIWLEWRHGTWGWNSKSACSIPRMQSPQSL